MKNERKIVRYVRTDIAHIIENYHATIYKGKGLLLISGIQCATGVWRLEFTIRPDATTAIRTWDEAKGVWAVRFLFPCHKSVPWIDHFSHWFVHLWLAFRHGRRKARKRIPRHRL